MTAKEYLREARRAKVSIESKRERIEEMRAIAEGVSVPLKDVAVQSSGTGQSMANTVECIVDFTREIAEEALELIKMQREVQAVINQLDNDNQRRVMELYYLNGYTWEKVAERMELSVRRIYYIHGDALKKFLDVH